MKTQYIAAGVLACFVAAVAGCQQSTPEGADTPAEVPQPGAAAVEEAGPAPAGQSEPPMDDAAGPASGDENGEASIQGAAANVELALMTWEEMQEELIASKAGRVVVVDVWSTSCVPCRREFPHFVDLHRELGDEVACISFSTDYGGRASRPPESYREQVLEFLTEQEAVFDNVLNTEDPDAFFARLNLAAPPAVYVFDREGKLRKRFDNEDSAGEEFTYEGDVLPFVQQLLAES